MNNPHERIRSPENLPRPVIELHELLASHDIPHAFGGAIAANFYTSREPTADIDVNVFIPLSERVDDIQVITPILHMLDPQLTLEDAQLHLGRIREDDQTALAYKGTRVDLFFSFSDFHDEVAEQIKYVEYKGTQLPILAPEDLIIFKIMFSLYPKRREHDWSDIAGIIHGQRSELNAERIYKWLNKSFVYSDHKEWINHRLTELGLPDPSDN